MRLCLFGAAGDTANWGVSALMHAAVQTIQLARPETRITIFDNGWGRRSGAVGIEGGEVPVWLCGARNSRRYYRPESLWNIRWSARLGLPWNAAARAMREADAILDVSGGDSFADLYGERRFQAMIAPKQIALELGRPLVLLPQTYGPFFEESSRAAAREVVARSRMSWARDSRSFQAMRELLGPAFDAKRHREGVDMAFALAPERPTRPLPHGLEPWLEHAHGRPSIGLNVSGLVYNDPEAGAKFGFRADYRRLVVGLVERILRQSEARILLLPHVVAPEERIESDGRASRAILAGLVAADRERVAIAPEDLGPREAKWLIARGDWFCGTRMHATIAGLSSGVPTAAIAYSLKTRGVFETCGVGEHVADAREASTEEALETLWSSWLRREEARAELRERAPEVRRRAREQMVEILDAVERAPTPVGSGRSSA